MQLKTIANEFSELYAIEKQDFYSMSNVDSINFFNPIKEEEDEVQLELNKDTIVKKNVIKELLDVLYVINERFSSCGIGYELKIHQESFIKFNILNMSDNEIRCLIDTGMYYNYSEQDLITRYFNLFNDTVEVLTKIKIDVRRGLELLHESNMSKSLSNQDYMQNINLVSELKNKRYPNLEIRYTKNKRVVLFDSVTKKIIKLDGFYKKMEVNLRELVL